MTEKFKTGDRIEIRNNSGILHVFINSELPLLQIATGDCSRSLPRFDKPRLEFHRNNDGEMLVTLCDRQHTLPCDMYLFLIKWDGEVLAYKGHFDSVEEDDDAFVTIVD